MQVLTRPALFAWVDGAVAVLNQYSSLDRSSALLQAALQSQAKSLLPQSNPATHRTRDDELNRPLKSNLCLFVQLSRLLAAQRGQLGIGDGPVLCDVVTSLSVASQVDPLR